MDLYKGTAEDLFHSTAGCRSGQCKVQLGESFSVSGARRGVSVTGLRLDQSEEEASIVILLS